MVILFLLISALLRGGAQTADAGANSAGSSQEASISPTDVEPASASVGLTPGDEPTESDIDSDSESNAVPETTTEQTESKPVMDSEEERRYEATASIDSGFGLRPAGKGVGFFGIESSGRHIGYVIDISSSMAGTKIGLAKRELLKSLEGLTSDQSFSVYFFSTSAISDRRFIDCPATQTNLDEFRRWLTTIHTLGGTNPVPAMTKVLDSKCDLVFLLSDGEFMGGASNEVSRLNQHKAIVNTVSLQSDSDSMKRIAKDNDGEYRLIKN